MLYIQISPLRFMENIAYSIKRLNEIGLNVYQSGNYSATEITLNKVISELVKMKPKVEKNQELNEYYRAELGLAHGRLFKIYMNEGKVENAKNEYNKAVLLIGKKYSISSEEDLIIFVDKNSQ